MEHDATLAGLKVHDELLVHVLAVHGCECGPMGPWNLGQSQSAGSIDITAIDEDREI